MSVSFEKMFTETTVLQLLELRLNDEYVYPEDVISLEMTSTFDKPFIEGSIILKDSFALSELDIFDGKTILDFYGRDSHGDIFKRKFRIISIKNDEENERFKKYHMAFVDNIYYELINTYLSKSFKTDPITALKEYIDHLGLSEIMSENKVELLADSLEAYNFVVPQDRSVLEFLMYEFKQNGLKFWQDKSTLNIKKINYQTLEYVKDINGNNAIYTNNTANNDYVFKIQDYSHEYNNILKSNINKPVIEHLAFDQTKKVIDRTTTNLVDIYDDLKLNDKDLSDLQHTTGKRYETDVAILKDKQVLELQDEFTRNNKLEIVVSGNYKYNVIGKLANIQLKANPYMEKYVGEGDKFHSGTYFIHSIKDRYFGDKILSKITLYRMDPTQVKG